MHDINLAVDTSKDMKRISKLIKSMKKDSTEYKLNEVARLYRQIKIK